MDQLDKSILIDLVSITMPFGKYAGRILCDLPVSYLEWFNRKEAWPNGRLGELLQNLLVIKSNDLEYLLREIRTWKS